MKKWVKVLLITGACLAILGLFLVVMSIVFGENPMQEIRKDALRDGKFEHSYRIPRGTLKELEIAWVAGNVIIEPYDGEEILLHEKSSSHIPEKNQLTYEVEEDSLEIRYWKGKWNIDLGDMLSKDLRIQLPRDMARDLEELSIENVGAAFHLKDLTAEELEAESVSGDVKGLGLNIREISLETVSGDLQLQLLTCPRELKVDSVSGSTEVVLPADSEIRAKLHSISGEIRSELPFVTIQGIAKSDFEMNSVSGDLILRAAESK